MIRSTGSRQQQALASVTPLTCPLIRAINKYSYVLWAAEIRLYELCVPNFFPRYLAPEFCMRQWYIHTFLLFQYRGRQWAGDDLGIRKRLFWRAISILYIIPITVYSVSICAFVLSKSGCQYIGKMIPLYMLFAIFTYQSICCLPAY